MTNFIDSSSSFDETLFDVRGRHETRLAPTEDSIPISSDEVVDRIERHGREYARHTQHFPRPAEFVCDKKRGSAFRERLDARHSVVRENVKRAQVAMIAAKPLDHRSADRTLE